jgi:hypothetical protein
MKNSAKTTLASVLFLCTLLPASVQACAILSKEEAARRQQARIEQTKAEAQALHAEADLVFIGHISRMTISKETVKDDLGREVLWQTHQLEFNVFDTIKGQYAKGQVLEFKVNKGRIEFGCGPIAFRSSLPRENGTGENYLVYARDGKILRTNHIPFDVQPLTGYEEASFLRGAQ